MKYRVYKEGNYLFFEDLDNKIVYTGPDTEVKIISVDTVNENFTVNGTSPMFPNPLKFSEVYKKNLEKYSKQEWIKFYTSESNYIPTDGFTGTMDDIVDGSTYVKTENNYTDAEKTKLSGIEPFAEANNISDSDALELTDGNDTTLHFHASDRNRANHTGTQTASTISDFGTGVQNSSLSGYTLGANTPISNLDDVKGAFGKAQAQINSKQDSLGFTPEDSANKSTSTGDSGSSVKFPVWSAIVSYFSAIQIRSILGVTTLSGSNTGDETTATIQSKRPLKTVNGVTLEGAGDVTTTTSPAGLNGEIQFNNSGSFGSATNATIVDEELTLMPVSNPNTPTSGLKLTSVNLAEKILLYTKDRDGVYSPVQSNMYMNSIYLMKAAGNSTNATYIGGVSVTAVGAATASSVAVTNLHTQMKRVDFLITTPATNAVAGFRNVIAQYFRGSSSSEGGFFFVGRWGPATGVSTATNQACFGMHGDQTAPSNASPITVINQISMGWESADANIQIMHNDGTGNASKIDLGASFPVPTADRTKVYELVLFCKPGGSDVYYRVMDLGTGSVATGTINSDLPSATTLMHARGWMSAGGTSSVIGMAVMSIYIETFN